MKREPLVKYRALVRCYAPSLEPLQEVCTTVTEEGLEVAVSDKISEGGADLRDVDIVVALCQGITDEVEGECSTAAQFGKAVLACCVGKPSGKNWLRLKTVAGETPGGAAWSIPRANSATFLTSYCPKLSRAARILDATHARAEDVRNPFVARFVHRLSQWQVLEGRLFQNARFKQAVADFFLDLYLKPMVQGGISKLFFESGSSTAFLCERFLPRLSERWIERETGDLDVETNNILCWMELVEAKRVRLRLYPEGSPPDTKYGAVFGKLENIQPETGPLSPNAVRALDEVRDHLSSYRQNGIIFGATSGIDLDPRGSHPGPHVGSFHNMLLKRAILASGAPVVLFLDQDKLPYPYIPDRCFSVCDSQFTWEHVCADVPLALACAFDDERRAEEVLPALVRIGFDQQQPSRPKDRPWCIVAANKKFVEKREGWKPSL